MHTQEEYQASKRSNHATATIPADTMEGMEKQLDEILDDIDPRCEDY